MEVNTKQIVINAIKKFFSPIQNIKDIISWVKKDIQWNKKE